jgi:hypothetical protein
VQAENLTSSNSVPSSGTAREAILLDSLVSAHTILGAHKGEFLSLLEPPAATTPTLCCLPQSSFTTIPR